MITSLQTQVFEDFFAVAVKSDNTELSCDICNDIDSLSESTKMATSDTIESLLEEGVAINFGSSDPSMLSFVLETQKDTPAQNEVTIASHIKTSNGEIFRGRGSISKRNR